MDIKAGVCCSLIQEPRVMSKSENDDRSLRFRYTRKRGSKFDELELEIPPPRFRWVWLGGGGLIGASTYHYLYNQKPMELLEFLRQVLQ